MSDIPYVMFKDEWQSKETAGLAFLEITNLRAEITRLQKELETARDALRMISEEAKESNEPIGRSVFKALATCGEIADLALKDKEVADG